MNKLFNFELGKKFDAATMTIAEQVAIFGRAMVKVYHDPNDSADPIKFEVVGINTTNKSITVRQSND